MVQSLSMDLRSRLLAAVDGGMSCRGAAARFGVAPSTAIRWHALRRETGGFAPRPQGCDMRSRRVEERSDDTLALWAARKDITLEELRAGLAEMGLTVSVAGLHRFFVRRGMMRKKDCSCSRARSARCPEATARLVRRPDRFGTRTPRVHRRNMDRDQHDPQPWPLLQGRVPAHGLPAWPPQNGRHWWRAFA
jgi:transposase